jgi:hypothetical protein
MKLDKKERNRIYKKVYEKNLRSERPFLSGLCYSLLESENIGEICSYALIRYPEFALFEPMESLPSYATWWKCDLRGNDERFLCLEFCIAMTEE